MDAKLRGIVGELETASDKLNAKTQDIERMLRRIGPTPVIDGKPVEQTIVFTGSPDEKHSNGAA